MAAPTTPVLALWVVDLDDDRAPSAASLLARVSRAEAERGARHGSPEAARRWLRSRAALRSVLSSYLGVGPLEIQFLAGEAGRPAVVGAADLHFSLSHSRGRALIAASTAGDVGADVEWIRPVRRMERIAGRVLGVAAARALSDADPSARTSEFFSLWVRHEATVKCRGIGLAAALGRDVAGGLSVEDVDAGPGYAAAVAHAVAGPRDVAPVRVTWAE